jgi:hypothetical protein
MCRATRPKEEGVSRSSRTRAGRRWTPMASARRVLAGRATVSKAIAHTTGAIGVRQNRVVLAPGVCAPSVAVMWRPDRARASIVRKATGAIVQRSPGRARHKPFQPLRREGRDVPVALFSAMRSTRSLLLAWRSTGATGSRPSLRLLSIQRAKRSGKARASKPRGCDPMSIIHRRSCPGRSAARSDALQSRGPCISERCGSPGPGSAQQRKSAAARPGHARLERRTCLTDTASARS